MKIFVVGSLNMDLTVCAPHIPQKGETVRGNGFLVTAGGKGANQAVACARLGANTFMVGCVGEEFGQELLDSLQSSGANVEFVARKEGVSSGTAVIIVSGGDNRIIVSSGANAMANEELIDCALKEAEAGDFLIAQLEIATPAVCHALKVAKQKGMVTLLNPAPAAALPDEIFCFCDYFLPNQTEAEFYTGVYPKDEESAKRCANILRQKGVECVLITLGEQGAAYISQNEYWKAEAFPVKAIDTTAAGDTFVGAFAVKLSEGAAAQEAMRFANAASAVTVTRRGAQAAIPTRKEAEEVFKSKNPK